MTPSLPKGPQPNTPYYVDLPPVKPAQTPTAPTIRESPAPTPLVRREPSAPTRTVFPT